MSVARKIVFLLFLGLCVGGGQVLGMVSEEKLNEKLDELVKTVVDKWESGEPIIREEKEPIIREEKEPITQEEESITQEEREKIAREKRERTWKKEIKKITPIWQEEAGLWKTFVEGIAEGKQKKIEDGLKAFLDNQRFLQEGEERLSSMKIDTIRFFLSYGLYELKKENTAENIMRIIKSSESLKEKVKKPHYDAILNQFEASFKNWEKVDEERETREAMFLKRVTKALDEAKMEKIKRQLFADELPEEIDKNLWFEVVDRLPEKLQQSLLLKSNKHQKLVITWGLEREKAISIRLTSQNPEKIVEMILSNYREVKTEEKKALKDLEEEIKKTKKSRESKEEEEQVPTKKIALKSLELLLEKKQKNLKSKLRMQLVFFNIINKKIITEIKKIITESHKEPFPVDIWAIRIDAVGDLHLPFEEFVSAIANAEELRELDIAFGGIEDEGLKDLSEAKWPKFQKLVLSYCPGITDGKLKHLKDANWPEFQVLNLAGCGDITDDGLKYLSEANWPGFQKLNLGWCHKITDEGLKYLAKAKWPWFQKLDLNRCGEITDEGLKYLAKANWTKLQELNLDRLLKITAKGLDYLKKAAFFYSLKKLNLERISVPVKNREKLQKRFPNVEIVWD